MPSVGSIEAFIGSKIKRRRYELRRPAEDIADKLGVSVEQLLNMERGQKRTSVSQLWNLSIVLEVDVSYFFATDGESQSGQGQKDVISFPRKAV